MAIQAAQVSTEVRAPPDSVWKALTTAKILGDCFFGSTVETDWNVGRPILFRGEWKGKRFEDKGEITAFSPPTHLRFTHWSALTGTADKPENYHLVDFVLSPSGARTKVTVTQENQDGKPVDTGAQQALSKNWKSILDVLKKAVESTQH